MGVLVEYFGAVDDAEALSVLEMGPEQTWLDEDERRRGRCSDTDWTAWVDGLDAQSSLVTPARRVGEDILLEVVAALLSPVERKSVLEGCRVLDAPDGADEEQDAWIFAFSPLVSRVLGTATREALQEACRRTEWADSAEPLADALYQIGEVARRLPARGEELYSWVCL